MRNGSRSNSESRWNENRRLFPFHGIQCSLRHYRPQEPHSSCNANVMRCGSSHTSLPLAVTHGSTHTVTTSKLLSLQSVTEFPANEPEGAHKINYILSAQRSTQINLHMPSLQRFILILSYLCLNLLSVSLHWKFCINLSFPSCVLHVPPISY